MAGLGASARIRRSIPLVLSADDAYSPLIATAVLSACEHTAERVSVIVLDGGITSAHRERLVRFASAIENCDGIDFLAIDLQSLMPGVRDLGRLTKTTFARFFIPDVCPEHSRVLYSDADVLFVGDLGEMFDEPLEGHAIGAVWEEFGAGNVNVQRNRAIGLPPDNRYFSAGNLIIDCEQWRSREIRRHLVELEGRLRGHIRQQDQDILNIYFARAYRQLPARYCLKSQDLEFYQEVPSPVIRHYNGPIKPWHIHPDVPESSRLPFMCMKNRFWDCARRTPFYDEFCAGIAYETFAPLRKILVQRILQRGKERNFHG